MAFLAGIGAALGQVAATAGTAVGKGALAAGKAVAKGAGKAAGAVADAAGAVGEGVVEGAQAVGDAATGWTQGLDPSKYVKSFSELPSQASQAGDFAGEFASKFQPTYSLQTGQPLQGAAQAAPNTGALSNIAGKFGLLDEAGQIDKMKLLQKGWSMMQGGAGGAGMSQGPLPPVQHSEVQPGAGGLGALPMSQEMLMGLPMSEEELLRLRRRFGGTF